MSIVHVCDGMPVCQSVCMSVSLYVSSVKYKTQRVFSGHSHNSVFTDILTSLLSNRLADKYVAFYLFSRRLWIGAVNS